MGLLSRKPERVRRQAMPVAMSIQWKPLRDSHYIVASLQPKGGGLRQIFARQSVLREVQALACGHPEQPVVGLLLGERLDCALTLAPYVLIESHIEVALTSLDEGAIAGAIRALRGHVKGPKSREVLGWYCSGRSEDARVSVTQAAVHAACFTERWQPVLTFGDGGDTGAFFLYDSSASRWFHAPFYELTDSKAGGRRPKPTSVAWPAYLTTASVVPLAEPPRPVPLPPPQEEVVAAPVSPTPRQRSAAHARPIVTVRRTPVRDGIVGMGRAVVERIVRVRAERAALAAQRKAEAHAAHAREEERRAKEAAERRAAREAAQRRAAEAAKQRAAEAEARRAEEAEARRKAAEEAERLRAAEAEARRKAAEEAEQLRAAEAEARRKADEEAEQLRAAQAEAMRQAAEVEAQRRAEEMEARRQAAEEAQRKAAEEEQQRAAEAEAHRQAVEAEARRQAAEAEAQRLLEVEAEARRQAAEAAAEAERRALEAEAEAQRLAAEAEAEAQRLAAEADAEAQRIAAEAEAEQQRLAAEAEAEAQRLAAEAEETARRKALEAEAEARRTAAEAEALRISVEVAALRERLARAPVEGSKRDATRSTSRLADHEDTTASDDPSRYLELAQREGFEVSEKIERGTPEHPETFWLLYERASGLRLIVVTTDDEVCEASLHYNLRTEDDSLLRFAAPEDRDREPSTIYGREACLDDLRARCRRLRATGALERDWKAAPTLQQQESPRYSTRSSSPDVRPPTQL